MRSTLFLLVNAAIVGSLLAQYPSMGCTRHVTLPSTTYAVPTYQPQCQCQCYQPQQCSRMNIVPYNYCQQPILQQNIVPPPCPIYQSAPLVIPVPCPAQPTNCCESTVMAPPPLQPSCSNSTPPVHHPPICVQTVYVAKDDDDEKEEKKCECKKKKKNYDPQHEDYHYEREERLMEARRRAAYLKRRKQQALANLLRQLGLGSDLSDPSILDLLRSLLGSQGGGGFGDPSLFSCSDCPQNPRGGATIIVGP